VLHLIMHSILFAYYKELADLRKHHGQLTKGLVSAYSNKDYPSVNYIKEQLQSVQSEIEFIKNRIDDVKGRGLKYI
jgi:hypothetical protein